MKCPEDYNDAMQSDSEPMNDPLYMQEEQNAPASPASPQLSGGVSSTYRKRQREKKKQGRQDSFDAANKLLTDKRNRITTPTREEDDDEISRPATEPVRKKTRKYTRNKPSVVWRHVTKLPNVDKVQCNHCASFWWHLSGSTSTPLKHVKEQHYNKLTDEQKQRMSKNGETSVKGGTVPKRTLCKKMFHNGPLPRSNKNVKRVAGKLARVLISSTA